jgi:hypothetical protein
MSYLTETTAEAMLTADLSRGRGGFNPTTTAEAVDPSAHWSDAAIVEAWHEDGSSDLAPVAMIRRDYRSALEAYLATID